MQARSVVLWSVLAALALSAPASAQSSRWQTTLESAKRQAMQNNQLVLIHFWAPYCTACRRMEQEVFPDPTVTATLQAYYVPVKINTEYFPATANQFGITSLPTDVVITPQGQVVGKFEGMVKSPEYANRLGQLASSARSQSPPAVYAQVPPGQPRQAPASGYSQAMAGNAVPGNSNAGAAAPQTPAYQSPAVAAIPAYGAPQAAAAIPPQGPPAQQTAPVQQIAPAQPGLPAPIGATPSPYAGMVPNTQAMPVAMPVAMPTYSPAPAVASAPATPQLGLEGFCPVRLVEGQKWVPGDRRWGVIHQGRVYLFSGASEQARFYASPDTYAPVLSGNDVVIAAETGQMVLGQRQHGVFYGNRIYLFSSEQSLQKFERQPDRFAVAASEGPRSASYPPPGR